MENITVAFYHKKQPMTVQVLVMDATDPDDARTKARALLDIAGLHPDEWEAS